MKQIEEDIQQTGQRFLRAWPGFHQNCTFVPVIFHELVNQQCGSRTKGISPNPELCSNEGDENNKIERQKTLIRLENYPSREESHK